MKRVLRNKRRASDLSSEDRTCPICLECTENDNFRFPCGHFTCTECNEKMLLRNFLACPTCRTPRENVSQQEVDSANRERVESTREHESIFMLTPSGSRFQVIFFPDGSGGANPFGPLQLPTSPTSGDSLHAQTVHASQVAEGEFTNLPVSTDAMLRLSGPMRALLNSLLSTSNITEFLAQRENVRGRSDQRRSTLRRF